MRPVPSRTTRLRWWLEDRTDAIRGGTDSKVLGGILLVGLLLLGGFAARQVVRAQASTTPQRLVRITRTQRQLVRTRVHGHIVTRWRIRRRVVYARAQTVLQTQTIHTPTGTRIVTRRVRRYHVVYRKQVVTRNGRTQTVSRPVTNVQTQTVRVTQPVTDTQVRTQTVPVTTTVVETTTETVTITLPATTVTVTVPTTAVP